MQQTFEMSVKAITETVTRTLSTIPQNQPQEPTSQFPPVICCESPAASDICNPSDYRSAVSIPQNPSMPCNESQYNSEQSMSTTSSKQDIQEFVNALREPKMTFMQQNQTTDVMVWKRMTALKCAKNLKHKHLVIQSISGSYNFNPEMSNKDNSTLFVLVYNALGTMSDRIIVDVESSNGISLLQQLQDYYIKFDMSVVNHQLHYSNRNLTT